VKQGWYSLFHNRSGRPASRCVWRLHSGRNRLDMRVKTKFGVFGHPSHIELNWVARPIPTPVGLGNMNQK